MNWKQLHTSSTPEERLKRLIHMLQVIETREQKVVFTGRRWVRNRRQGYQAHFLNDRRGSRLTLQRIASLLTFGMVLLTVSATTAAVTLHAPLHISAPAVFFYATSLLGVLAFKPSALRMQVKPT